MTQTAREFTPNKKPSLASPTPATVQQHAFGVEGSGIRQMGESTATKTSLGQTNGAPHDGHLGAQGMSVTQFSGKPVYTVQKYP